MDLDLHGVKHIDVEWIVENHIGKYKPPYKIITGNSHTMKEIVKNILVKRKIEHIIWSSNLGSISIV